MFKSGDIRIPDSSFDLVTKNTMPPFCGPPVDLIRQLKHIRFFNVTQVLLIVANGLIYYLGKRMICKCYVGNLRNFLLPY